MALLKNLNDKPQRELPKEFSIEWQWGEYLRRVKLDPAKMSAIQFNETKRAFVGAYGQLLMSIKHDLADYTEAEVIAIMQHMEGQVLDYFQAITGRGN